jgi:hypothetical protein
MMQYTASGNGRNFGRSSDLTRDRVKSRDLLGLLRGDRSDGDAAGVAGEVEKSWASRFWELGGDPGVDASFEHIEGQVSAF